MVSRLWTGSTTPGSQITEAATYHCGKFHVTTAGQAVTGVRWYRASTGSPAPSRLAIVDVAAGAVLVEVPVPDNLAVGWQQIAINAPYGLTSGRNYAICANEPTNFRVSWTSPAPTPDSPLVYEGQVWNGGTFPLPITGQTNSDLPFLDVIVEAAPGGTVGPTIDRADVDNALAAWLINTGDNTHQSDGLPWQTKADTAVIRATVGGTAGQLDATKAVSDTIHDLLTATNKNLGTLWDLAGHLTELELPAYKALFGSGAARLTGPNSAGGSAFYTADGNLVSQLVAETWQRVRVLRGDIGFGTDGWTMTAEEDFEDAIAFVHPADAYSLHITSYQP